jgi:hypothetical protein
VESFFLIEEAVLDTDQIAGATARIGHGRHTCMFFGASTRFAARAGSGMLAAVNAHAVKESQTDLRFMG